MGWGGHSLRHSFPRLYDVSLAKGRTMAEVGGWVENRWVWHVGWRRSLRGWEEDSMSNLFELLVCRKQVPNEPDLWEWKPESSRIFTVRSAYKILLHRKMEVNMEFKSYCSLIWENHSVPKAQATAWRALFRRLATRHELKRRGVLNAHMDLSCPVCNQTEETVDHLLIECNQIAFLWSCCLQWIGVSAPLGKNIPMNALQFSYLDRNKDHRRLLSTLWVCMIWMIWKSRNEIVFKNGKWNHIKIQGEVKAYLWNCMGGKGEWKRAGNSFRSWCTDPLLSFA